jgi:hypothetical protein
MKTHIVAIALIATCLSVLAQKSKPVSSANRIQQIEDRLALKELVDTFSILADKKDVPAQVLLFTEDATVETFSDGDRVANLKGRKEMENSFGPFLSRFEKVYHFNGQHTVKVEGDRATGMLYCMVTLIGMEDSKRMKTTIGVYYNDKYLRKDGQWLIAKRKSTFDWQNKEEIQ